MRQRERERKRELNFANALYTVQLDVYALAPFAYGAVVIGHPDYTAKSFIAIEFSNRNCPSPADTRLMRSKVGLHEESSPLQRPIGNLKTFVLNQGH